MRKPVLTLAACLVLMSSAAMAQGSGSSGDVGGSKAPSATTKGASPGMSDGAASAKASKTKMSKSKKMKKSPS